MKKLHPLAADPPGLSAPLVPPRRTPAEAQWSSPLPSSPCERPAEALLQELQIHQIELEMQNEALRQVLLALEESRDRYVDLYDFAPLGYLTLTAEGTIAEINLTASRLLRRPREQLLHRSFSAFLLEADVPCWARHLAEGRGHEQIELSLLRGDETRFWAQIDCLSAPHGVRLALTDITGRKEADAAIQRLAYYDPLTRLPNRRLLQDRLDQAVAASMRSQLYGAMFFIDLDNFKALNDTRGHDVGDLLLVEVARRLRAAVREADTVARQGGDEFVVLMENLGADAAAAAELARQLGDKLREAIERPIVLEGQEHHCRLSIGVGLFDQQGSVEELFKRADLALYQAKKDGRSKLRFFDPAMQAALELRCALESELRQALQHRQLRLYYQPQVDAERQVIGVEALLRWHHPQRGLVHPNDFIPLAEDTGLILPLGLWVLETACAQLKRWEAERAGDRGGDTGIPGLKVAVNVSARQLRDPNFVRQVERVLEASGANPARLKLELTESTIVANVPDTLAKMEALKRLGVGFSLDDFGTGFSSLSCLAQFPFEQIKIDQSFVRKLPGQSTEETIAQTIINLGRGLDMNVIAEGVETEAQHEILAAQGCHGAQGFLFSRPLPVDKFEEFMRRRAH